MNNTALCGSTPPSKLAPAKSLYLLLLCCLPLADWGGGGGDKFDNLPPQYRANVNTREAPYNRHLGEQPALTSDEIDAIVAFLKTLTDDYHPR